MPSHVIPVNSQNATSSDWVILLEAGTIIGPSPERLRVARSTLERKIVKKYTLAHRVGDTSLGGQGIACVKKAERRARHHSMRQHISTQALAAHAVEGGITERRPWYDPSEKLPDRPIIDAQMNMEFDTVVVPSPAA